MYKFIFLNIIFFNLLFSDQRTEILTHLPSREAAHRIEAHINGSDLAGGVSADVFFIYDAQNELSSVVKSQCDHSLSQEFEAMKVLKRMQFDHFDLPIPLHLGKFISEGKEHFFIQMSPVKGETLNDLFKKIPQLKGKAREAHIKIVKEAIFKTGVGLGELHARSSSYKRNVASDYRKDLTHMAQNFLRLIEGNSRTLKLNYSQVESMVSDILGNLTLGEAGITHGDLHPGNIIYDAESKRIAFIDFNDMVPSLSGPVGGSTALDFAATLGYIDQFCTTIGELSSKERKELTTAFIEGYGSQHTLPRKEIAQNLTALFYMEQILCFYKYQSPSASMVTQAESFTQFARDQIKSYREILSTFPTNEETHTLARS